MLRVHGTPGTTIDREVEAMPVECCMTSPHAKVSCRSPGGDHEAEAVTCPRKVPSGIVLSTFVG